MIDILLVDEVPNNCVGLFLSKVFDCPVERIKIISLEDFNVLTEQIDESAFHCVCVTSSVKGSVSQLLQLFRYKMGEANAFNRIVDVALEQRIKCFLPTDSLGGWIFLGDSGAIRHAQQIETDEEDSYLFRLVD
jgi:hypothetical protein